MTKLESLLPAYAKAEPQSEYSPLVTIMCRKNIKFSDEQQLLKKFRKYNLLIEKSGPGEYMLRPSDGSSRDILMDYIWRYFKDK